MYKIAALLIASVALTGCLGKWVSKANAMNLSNEVPSINVQVQKPMTVKEATALFRQRGDTYVIIAGNEAVEPLKIVNINRRNVGSPPLHPDISGIMIAHLRSSNRYNAALITKNGEFFPSTIIVGLSREIIEKMVKDLKLDPTTLKQLDFEA